MIQVSSRPLLQRHQTAIAQLPSQATPTHAHPGHTKRHRAMRGLVTRSVRCGNGPWPRASGTTPPEGCRVCRPGGWSDRPQNHLDGISLTSTMAVWPNRPTTSRYVNDADSNRPSMSGVPMRAGCGSAVVSKSDDFTDSARLTAVAFTCSSFPSSAFVFPSG